VKAPVAPSAPSLDSGGSRISGLIARFSYWLTLLVYIVISLALVFFLWGVVKYVLSGGDEEKRQQGRNFIVYGIIGLFVMVAVWGLVYLVGSIIGVKPGGGVDLPQLPGGNFAAGSSGSKLITIINLIGGWVSSIVLVLIGLAFLFFLWGVANYIGSGADEEKRTEAKRFVAFGIAGLFVMVAVWGLVYLVGATVGIKPGGGASTVPQIETVKINDVVDPTTGKVLISGGSADSTAFSSCDGYTWPENKSFKSIVCLVLKVLNPIPPILVALAMLYFFWGVAKYIKAGGDAEEMRKGRSTIVYGILALFIIVAVWGVVAVFKNELGL
jgi:heme/copper-type cytochrome/quinol oxidase subunit 2